jgi:pimeloyl-ACP methyl ester carboxylesterase
MPEFRTATGALHYDIFLAGAGPGAPTLTLLHNFMSAGRAAWGALLPVLNEHYRILLPDLPGHGRSHGHPAGYDHRAIARQIAALMAAEQALDGHLAGCSSGGMVAQQMVHLRLVRPATLTLVSTTYSVNPQTTGNLAGLRTEDFDASPNWLDATARLHDPYHYDGYYHGELLPAFRQLSPATAIDLPLEALTAFRMPVCVIHGSDDEFFPTYIAEEIAAAAPLGELHIVPNQKHALLFRQPWRVAQIMLEFLNKHNPSAASS